MVIGTSKSRGPGPLRYAAVIKNPTVPSIDTVEQMLYCGRKLYRGEPELVLQLDSSDISVGKK